MNCIKWLKESYPFYRHIKLNSEWQDSWMQIEFATMFTDQIPTVDE